MGGAVVFRSSSLKKPVYSSCEHSLNGTEPKTPSDVNDTLTVQIVNGKIIENGL